MTYEPLITKYRPRTLDDLIGQKETTVNLIRGIYNGRVPRTMIIYGPYGCGKTTIARMIAMHLNCTNRGEDGSPCVTDCPSCRLMLEQGSGAHQNVTEMNAAKDRGIDEMRRMSEVSRYSAIDGRLVFIMDEAHMLTPQAFQSMLKVFEEGGTNAVFMLVTSEHHKVPDNILSRCSPIEVVMPHYKITAKYLLKPIAESEGVNIPDKILALIAKREGGRPRNSLVLLEQVITMVQSRTGMSAKDIARELPAIVKKAIGNDPADVADKYLLACVLGKPQALMYLDDVKEAQALVERVAWQLKEQYLKHSSAIKSRQPTKAKLDRVFRNMGLDNYADAARAVSKCSERLRGFLDNTPFLVDMTYRLLVAFGDDE